MRTQMILWALSGALMLLIGVGSLVAQPKQELRTVAIKVLGLHCEGCVEPVEQGLRKVQGVRSAELEFKAGIVMVRYDEAQVALSQVVLALPKIPHAMGPRSGMRYEGRLLLMLAKGDAKKVASAIQKLRGVAKVEQERKVLRVAFKPDATVHYAQIEQAVKRAGGALAPAKPDTERNHEHHH